MVKTKALIGSNPAINIPIVTNSMDPAKMVAAKTGGVHQGNPWLVAYKSFYICLINISQEVVL